MSDPKPLPYMVRATDYENICRIFAFHAQTEKLIKRTEIIKRFR